MRFPPVLTVKSSRDSTVSVSELWILEVGMVELVERTYLWSGSERPAEFDRHQRLKASCLRI